MKRIMPAVANDFQGTAHAEAAASGEGGTQVREPRETEAPTYSGPDRIRAFQEARLRTVIKEMRDQADAESSDVEAQAYADLMRKWVTDLEAVVRV